MPSYRTGFKLSKLKSEIDKRVTEIIIIIYTGKKIERNLPRSSIPPLTAHILMITAEKANIHKGVSGNETIRTNSEKFLITSAPKLNA